MAGDLVGGLLDVLSDVRSDLSGQASDLWSFAVNELPEIAERHRMPLLIFVAAVLGWYLLRWLASLPARRRALPPGPPAKDLPGDEPPALVSLMASGWTVTDDAVEATLLDLAARGHLEFRQSGADAHTTTVRVTTPSLVIAGLVDEDDDKDDKDAAEDLDRDRTGRAAGDETPLNEYERQVLNHVRRVAEGGSVRLAALAFTDRREAARWFRSFAGAVLEDARERELVRRRVPGWLAALLGLAALAPGLALGRLLLQVLEPERPTIALLGLLAAGLLTLQVVADRGHVGTRLGREAAAGWMGLRAYLEANRAFAHLPPAAVSRWDRYVAYGKALGVTRLSVRTIDLGPTSRRLVWSTYGGRWHQIRVHYPPVRARYGSGSRRLVARNLLTVVLGAALLTAKSWSQISPGNELVKESIWWERALAVLPWIGVLLLLRGVYRLLRTLVDLVAPRTVQGEVVWISPWKHRRTGRDRSPVLHYLALDDGTSDRTTAWAMPESITRGFGPRDTVEVKVRRWSRRVLSLRVQLSHGDHYGAVHTRLEPVVGRVEPPSTGPLRGLVRPPEGTTTGSPDPSPGQSPEPSREPPPATTPRSAPRRSGPASGSAAWPPHGPRPSELLSEQELSSWFGVDLEGRLEYTPPVEAWSYHPRTCGPGHVFVVVQRRESPTGQLTLPELPYGVADSGGVAWRVIGAKVGDVRVQLGVTPPLRSDPEFMQFVLAQAVSRLRIPSDATAGRTAPTDGRQGDPPHGDRPAWPG